MTDQADETFYLNCSLRYLLNQTNLSPIPIQQRYTYCELINQFMPNTLIATRILFLTWLISGIFGNLLSFIIWSSRRQRRKNSSAVYLAALAIIDLFLILFLLNYAVEQYWCTKGLTTVPGICQIFQCLFIFTQYYSIVLVFGFTLERYLAVCFPFKRHKLCTTKRALLAISILAIFVLFPMFCQAVLWTSIDGECHMRDSVVSNEGFQTLLFVQEVLFSLVIPLATLVFNILVLCEIRRLIHSSTQLKRLASVPDRCTNVTSSKSIFGRQRTITSINSFKRGSSISFSAEVKSKESSQFIAVTLMLIVLSFYLIICTVPASIVYLIQFKRLQPDDCLSDEYFPKSNDWISFFTHTKYKYIIDALCASHYACNFFIYFISSQSFRQQSIDLLKCKPKKSRHISETGVDTFMLYRRRAPRTIKQISNASEYTDLRGNSNTYDNHVG